MKRGRPPHKPGYNPEELIRELINAVAEVYTKTKEIKATAVELDLPPNKVKKLLITAGVVNYPETEQIQNLQAQGRSMAEIQESLGLSKAAINTYLPYSKVIYKLSEISQNAERVKRYKERKAAVEELHANMCEENLWTCVVAFQNYPFHTSSGLPFIYTIKRGRDGSYTGELIVSRKEDSKTLTRSSIMLAFHKVLEQEGTVFTGPKAIGQIFGISYIYSMFWRLGAIAIPEKVEERMKKGSHG